MGAWSVSNCSTVSTACGSRLGRVSFVHGPFHNLHLHRTHHTATLQRRQDRQQGFQPFAEHGAAGSDRRCGPDPGGGFPVGELQYPYQELGHGGRAVLPRQISGVGSGDQPVINQREFVADAFEALPHRDLLVRFEVIKPAGFDGADHIGESGSETIEGLIQRALVAFRCCGVPEFHVYILFETVFDDKSFS
jgi:hypothetical protein